MRAPTPRSKSNTNAETKKKQTNRKAYSLMDQLKEVLTMHLLYIFLCYLVVVGVEVNNIQNDPVNFSLFNILFELISGYGTTGLSWGLPNTSLSLAGGFHTISKIILISLQILGRHRGMPQAVDKAIQLGPDVNDIQFDDQQQTSTSEEKEEKQEKEEKEEEGDGIELSNV